MPKLGWYFILVLFYFGYMMQSLKWALVDIAKQLKIFNSYNEINLKIIKNKKEL